jgi:hypothetical protein
MAFPSSLAEIAQILFKSVLTDQCERNPHLLSSTLSGNSSAKGHDAARRIVNRKHFHVLYERNPTDIVLHSNPGEVIADAAINKFGDKKVRYSKPKLKDIAADFPVRTRDGRIVPAIAISEVLTNLKPVAIDYVFIDPDFLKDASDWLSKERTKILEKASEKDKKKAKK